MKWTGSGEEKKTNDEEKKQNCEEKKEVGEKVANTKEGRIFVTTDQPDLIEIHDMEEETEEDRY